MYHTYYPNIGYTTTYIRKIDELAYQDNDGKVVVKPGCLRFVI